MKKSSLAEMREEYIKMPITENTIEIDGVPYTVVSHYVGGKELTAVIRAIAERQAEKHKGMNTEVIHLSQLDYDRNLC